ncbi:hypothetical protein K523DRAFT_297471 [Schizophyllum commune Tattone D]|nr:hypothetical protein K523DRAFT_297471 [Schizophyllum commune Tattone D]
MARTVKVAIIGSGLAGLTAAHLLARPAENERDVHFEVHIIEKANALGMDASSVSVRVPGTKEEKDIRVNVPMRSFQGGHYPQLIAMYKKLGIRVRVANFTYSFSRLLNLGSKHGLPEMSTYLLYNGASGRKGVNLPSEKYPMSSKGAFKCAESTETHLGNMFRAYMRHYVYTFHLLLCYLWLVVQAVPWLRIQGVEDMVFEDWAFHVRPRHWITRIIGLEDFWLQYVFLTLVPLFSAVCTAPERRILSHPVEDLLDYIWLTLGTDHFVHVDGVREVVSKLSEGLENVHLSATTTAIQPDPTHPDLASIVYTTPTGQECITGVHHIIFATQASQAVPLLQSYADSVPQSSAKRQAVTAQIACLQTFTYERNIVINHTDDNLQPPAPADRRDLNLIVPGSAFPTHETWERLASQRNPPLIVEPYFAMATQVLPLPADYPPDAPRIYQTTNPLFPPREDSIISVARLERSVLTRKAKAALRGLHNSDGRRWWQGQGKLGPLQGGGRREGGVEGPGIWLCGSYAYPGIPLLEGCVASARNVVEQGVYAAEGVSPGAAPW